MSLQARPRAWHYIKPNETTRVPRRLIFVDTEAHKDPVPLGHEQRWAIAVACYRDQRPDRKAVERWGTYDDPDMLWAEVDAWCGKSGRTVLWTHNLGYDARISECLLILPKLGWSLVAHNLIGKGTWLTWRRGRATLVMVDSTSVFPMELIKLGPLVGLAKLQLPDALARGVGLYSRCWRDVEILRKAILEYLQWIEVEDLGNWQFTGAGQSWATFRHRFMDKRLLVHDDQPALAAERRAMWTGRCEAYWHGELDFQVVHEWDLSLAYPRIAKDFNVPVRLLGPMPLDYDWRRALGSKTTGLLARCTVTTEVPVVPTEHDGRILWPVGTFETTLWDPEISEAIAAGADIRVEEAWLYYKAPALKRWAEWIMEELDSLGDPDSHWKYPVLKHQARALIGRFAMTYTKWEEYAYAPTESVLAHSVYDATTEETFRVVQIGRTMWRDTGTTEWGESMPMVTGYVQSLARVRLWRIQQAAPEGSILYADTDSVLVTDMHSKYLDAIARAHPEWGLRLKRSWQGFAVWGPRQIRTGASVRVAGVSRHAVRTDRRTLRGEVWETLEGALARGHASQVVIRDRVWHVKGVDHRRQGPEIGWTFPIRLPVQEGQPDPKPEEETVAGQGKRHGATRQAQSGRVARRSRGAHGPTVPQGTPRLGHGPREHRDGVGTRRG